MNSYLGLFDYVIFICIFFLYLFLGLIVIFKNYRDQKNISFSLMTTGVVSWNTSAFVSEIVNNETQKLFLSRLSYFFAAVALFFAVIFIYKFLNIKKTKHLIFINSILFVFCGSTTLFTSLVVKELSIRSNGFDIINGQLYAPYLLIILFFIVQLVGLPLYKYKKSYGTQKQQIKYLFFGFVTFVIFALFFNVGIKYLIQSDQYYRYGNYSAIFLIAFTSYTLVKHRLMDIRLVVARSVTYAILLAFLALVYAGSVLGIERLFFQNALDQEGVYQIVLRTILAVVIAFTFQPLRKWITKVTDKIFFKNAYDPQKLLDELSHTMGSTIVLIELLYRVTDILIQEMKVSRGLFVLLKDESEIYTVQANGYRQNPEINIDDIIHLAKDGTVVYDELAESSRYKSILRKYEAAVSLPLKTEKEIVGVFLVGEKNSGDMFNQQDLRILEIVAPEVSVAIENAKSYEEISRFNVTLRNEVKRATHRLKEKNQQLRELDKAKDEFISMASHQLRTPLTAIKGYLSMLLDGDAGEIKVGQYDFINEAYSGANRMVGLINDLLNVSRMETGRFFLEPEDLDIEQIIKEEVQQLVNVAKEKGLYLKIDKKSDVPKVWADETKIRQVIMNFIDNAIHYTAKGGVTAKYGKEQGYFVFSVKDTGIGVPKEQQKKLFEKFFRADNARHSRPDGTGLGLFLAKRVVEDHNGSIFFSSIEGQGSVFGFRLPLKKSELIKPSILETKPTTVTTEKKEPTADKLAEPNPEDLLTEQQQVPIPVDEPEHVLRK